MASEWVAPEEDEEIEDELFLSLSKDTILFCIDASSSMHEIPPDKRRKSYFHQALQCALDVMKRKIIVCPNDSVGILFFNTEESEGEQAMKNHYVFLPVAPLTADTLRAVMEVLDGASEDPESLKTLFSPKQGGNVPIGDVFASCNHVLRAGAPKIAIKRVFYITDEDNPGSLAGPASKRLEDLVAQGIALVPFFVSTDDKPFDVNKFYAGVLNAGGNDEDAIPFGDVCDGFEQVIAEMRIREMPKRAMWSIPMEIAEGFTIGVKGYGLVTEHKKPHYKYMSASGANTEEVVSKTVYYDKEQQTRVSNSEILFGIPMNLGGEPFDVEEEDGRSIVKKELGVTGTIKAEARRPKQKVLFTAKQIRSFRTLDLDRGIKILGFKEFWALRFEDNTKHSYFLYPDESAYTGSTRAFSALLKSLVKHRSIGICRVTMRSNASPIFCALLPQREEFDDYETQVRPPGLHLIPFPFADEIREAPITEALRASDAMTEAATEIIKKMTLKKGYQPDAFPNPSLALHFAFVEANALGLEFDPDSIPDTTLPNYERIHSKVGPAITAWRDQLDKEPAAQMVGGPSRKRPGSDAAYDEAEIRTRYENGNLGKLTNAVIKDYLKAKGQKVPSSAKKADLLDLLTDYLDANETRK